MRVFKILSFLVMMFLSPALSAAPCEVTNSSGIRTPGSLLRQLYNQAGGGHADCDEILIRVDHINLLSEPVHLLGGNKIEGNNVTLTLAASVAGGCVIEIKSALAADAGAGGSSIENIKINGDGVRDGICIYSNDNTLTDVEVTNSDIGVLISGGDNDIHVGSKLYGNDIGVQIDGGDGNLITQASFYENTNMAIELLNGGNNGVGYPSLVIIVNRRNSVVGATGLVDDDTTQVEFFEADPASINDAQGEGKVYRSTFAVGPGTCSPSGGASCRFITDNNVLGLVANKIYTATTVDGNNNTSEFSPNFGVPTVNKITGDVPCLTAPAAPTVWWYLYALDGLDNGGGRADYYDDNGAELRNFDGNPWHVDSDGDGLSNLAEDTDQDCRLELERGETDPNVPPGPDRDGDGVEDGVDNCPDDGNPSQADSDRDGVGDACEAPVAPVVNDRDGDGIQDSNDNCIDTPNPDQADSDGDGKGHACDKELCEGEDIDGDGLGELCDPDIDNDGLANIEETAAGTDPTKSDTDGDAFCDGPGWGYDSANRSSSCIPMDNCPLVGNSDQRDSDDDGIGDACDNGLNEICSSEDSDGDKVEDYMDNCPQLGNPSQDDFDKDGNGDPCDFDDDNDGIDDVTENSMSLLGGALNTDADGDGVDDGVDGFSDNCPVKFNPLQGADTDSDGIGDECDINPAARSSDDSDFDGVSDRDDKCPTIWSPKVDAQPRDSDRDSVPDACDDDDDGDGLSDIEESKNYLLRWWDKYDPDVAGETPKMAWQVCVDSDEDGIPDGDDNCPNEPNATQEDEDGDDIGDVCDVCPKVADKNQLDSDMDGIGNACEAIFDISSADLDVSQIQQYDLRGGGNYWDANNKQGGCSGNLSAVSTGLDAGIFILWLIPLAGVAAVRTTRHGATSRFPDKN